MRSSVTMTNASIAPLRETALTERVPPHAFFLVSAVFHYLGPAFAVLLFAAIAPLGVAWLRIASAAIVFALWRRPWRYFRALGAAERRTVLLLGIVLAARAIGIVVLRQIPSAGDLAGIALVIVGV